MRRKFIFIIMVQMMKNTVIFDLDGTLLNTLDDLADSVNFALSQQGFPERSYEEVRLFVGNGIRKLIERSVPKNATPEQTELCYNTFCEYYKMHMEDKTKPYDGIPDLLYALKNAGIKTAVVTNKADFAAQNLCKEMFGDLITVTVGANDGIRHKPYPDGTNLALKLLGTKKEDAYFVGDSDVDILTAKNAGIDPVGVLWGFRDKATLISAGARVFAKNTEELKEILLSS